MPRVEYEDIPNLIRELLAADPWFSGGGINTYVDVNHYLPDDPATEDIDEQAQMATDDLATKGLAVGIESFAAIPIDQGGNRGVLSAIARVIVLENPRVNRGSGGGLKIPPAQVARRILKALLGKPGGAIQQEFKLPASGSLFEPYNRVGARVEYPIRLQILTHI